MHADPIPASGAPVSLPDSTPLHRLIGRTRRLLRGSWVATGLGIALGLAVGALAVLAVLDLFVPLEPVSLPLVNVVVPLDPILRCVALFLIVVPASLAFLQGVVRPLFRRLGPTLVARRIESHLPGIHNRLVSAIDLERADPATKPSPVFLRRLLNEALERVKDFRPSRILDYASLRRAGLTAAVAAVLAAGAWALFADRLPVAVARIFNPFADILPASGVADAVEPGTSDVLRNEDITFTARVERGHADTLRLEMYGARGSRKSYDLKQDRNDPAVFRLVVDGSSLGKGYEDGFRYRVYGGRTWSRQQSITLVDRPVIAGVATQVVYPKYMKIPQPQPTPPQAVAVAGPEGTKDDPSFVEVVVTSQHEVGTGEVQILEPASARIPPEKQQERAWFDDKLPTAVTPGGNWEFTTLAGRKVHAERGSSGTYGHWFHGDPVGLAVHRGDVLFAHVYLPSDSPPEAVMLEWHDGDGWEHRAYWGADRIREGRPNTASRYHAGPLPTPGKWARLEVPASRVGLEGQLLRGVGFKMHGGQAFWGRTGSVQLEEPSFKVVRSYPMEKKGDDLWAGRFPLAGSGLFRAELKNPSGHANKAMKELKYLSLQDLPPYVALDRKNAETVLSKAAVVPLSVIAFDDYGLDEVRVLFRGTTTEGHKARSLWSAGQKPLRNLNLEAALDEAKQLKTGGVLHYLVEARDTRGQTTRTQEYVVRVAADGAAADKALAELDKVQDTFRDKLVKLLGDQKKVKEKLDELNKENAKLAEKLDRVREETPPPADPKAPAPKTKPEDEKKAPQLSPEEQKRLAEIQKELAKLGAEEKKNADLADTLNKELKKNNEDAARSDLLPKAVLEQMNATQNLFEKAVSDALRNLEKDITDEAKSKTPDLKDLKDKSDAVDRNLDKVKDKLDALKDARKDLKDDLKKALDALRDKVAKADAKATARDLEDLKAFLEKLRNQTREAREKNDENADDTANEKGDPEKRKKTREDVEKDLEKLLAKARKLLDKKDKDNPEFPDAPYRADEKEDKVAPREADTDEPLPRKKDKDKADEKGDKADPKGDKDAKEDDEDEKKFMPRLGGKKEKIDPRYKGKQRPTKKKDKGEADDKDDEADRQNQNSRDADSAEKALKADEKTLDDLLSELTSKAGKGKPRNGKQGDDDSDPLADQLRQMMQSKSMRDALAMAAAAKRAQKGKPPAQRQPPPPPTQRDTGNVDGGDGPDGRGELGKLDPETRAMILKLPPSKYREELIRGLNEQGPEAYRAFIQNYFKQLTEKRSKK